MIILALKDKIRNLKECLDNRSIYDGYYNEAVCDDIVYLESRNGKDFTGNIFRITQELSTGEYGDFRIYVYASKEVKSKIDLFGKNYNLNITEIITDDKKATEILHKAKYIFTDSGIRNKYIKKQGQIFINTWHGTPLKLMGFDNPAERTSIGIIQRSFFFSDYLLYPNDYMMEKMTHAYMIDKIFRGKMLLEGYPRNSVFLDKTNIKDRLGLGDKTVYAYLPTYKGILSKRKDEKQKEDVEKFLDKINSRLSDHQILFVKFHPYNQSKIDFSRYSHIKAFPDGFENYDILNIADVLVTDYSSVFFDFANSGKKIVIFNYDEEEYLKDRGLYIPLESLPFPKVQNTDELIDELNGLKNYDDEKFVKEFCRYDSKDSVKRICSSVIGCDIVCKYGQIENPNKNILFYVGSMDNSEVKNKLIQMLEEMENVNVFLSYKQWDKNINENYMTLFDDIPKNVEFLPLSHNIAPTFKEKIDLIKFIKGMELNENLIKLFNRSYKRQFGNFKFDLVIDFASNDLESLIFAHSGLDNAIVTDESTQSKISSQFNKIYSISDIDLEKIIGEDR